MNPSNKQRMIAVGLIVTGLFASVVIMLLVNRPAVLLTIVTVVNFVVGILLWVMPCSSTRKTVAGDRAMKQRRN